MVWPPTCDLDHQTHVRFLVTNNAAEIIFGVLESFAVKITGEDESKSSAFEFQHQGVCIQVSRIDQVFPGTSERILMLSGTFILLVDTLDILLTLYGKQFGHYPLLRLIVPDRSCEVLTRPGGITIKSINKACQTTICVPPPNYDGVCLDRLVRVFGSNVQAAAIGLILSKLAEDSFYLPPLESPYTYAGDKKKQTHIRLLVSNTAAESIIEKHGSKSNEFVFMLSEACIQFSRGDETFPGTSDRILMVSGTFNNIIMAVELLFFNLRTENHFTDKINLIVPNRFCDAMTGGVTMKSIMEKSMTEINISLPSFSCDLLDSLVTVSGTGSGFEFRQMRAIYMILSKLTEDACYPPSLESPYTYAVGIPFCDDLVDSRIPSELYEANDCRSGGMEENSSVKKGKATQILLVGPVMPISYGCGFTMIIGVPDELMKDLRGHHGRGLTKIRQVSGVTIKIVDKDKSGDMGQSYRVVMISGPAKAIHNAKNMIVKKLEQKLRDDGMLLECSEYVFSNTC